ncbi:MAG: hypothetical protein ABW007_27560 [Chitinophagaceae bacterium]
MKRLLSLISILLVTLTVGAQHIVILDGEFGILNIDDNKRVRISSKYPPGPYQESDFYEFIKTKDSIAARSAVGIEKLSNELFSTSSYEQYPSAFPIRNNCFYVAPTGSVLSVNYDDRKRIHEIRSVISGSPKNDLSKHLYVTTFTYYDDTTVLELVQPPQFNASLSVFSLTADSTLKEIKTAVISLDTFDISSHFQDLQFQEATKFNYDKTGKNLLNIQYFQKKTKSNNWALLKTHYFRYKKNRPVNSFVIDEKTKKTIYVQKYEYLHHTF